MKKILIGFFLLIFGIFSYISNNVSFACKYNGDLKDFDSCFENTNLVKADNLNLAGEGFKGKIVRLTEILSIIIGVAAVFGIVFSAFRLVISSGKEEGISSAKKNFLWTILGFTALLFASSIVLILIKFVYRI